MVKITIVAVTAIGTALLAQEAEANPTMIIENSEITQNSQVEDLEFRTNDSEDVLNGANVVAINNGAIVNSEIEQTFTGEDVSFETEDSSNVINSLNFVGQNPGAM